MVAGRVRGCYEEGVKRGGTGNQAWSAGGVRSPEPGCWIPGDRFVGLPAFRKQVAEGKISRVPTSN